MLKKFLVSAAVLTAVTGMVATDADARSLADIKASGVPLEEYYMNMIDGNTQSPVTLKAAEEMEKVAKGAKV